jgi:hypothetical protein
MAQATAPMGAWRPPIVPNSGRCGKRAAIGKAVDSGQRIIRTYVRLRRFRTVGVLSIMLEVVVVVVVVVTVMALLYRWLEPKT